MGLYKGTFTAQGLKGLFMREAAQTPTLYQRLCTIAPSDSDEENYGWLGDAPQLVEFKDEIDAIAFSDTKYNLANKTFARSVPVHYDAKDDDKTGGIMMRIRQMAQVAARHPDSLLATLIANGTSATLGKCHDGGAFFASAHAKRGEQTATQDNLLDGTGTTTAALKTDIQSAWTQMQGFKAENNEPIASTGPYVVLCHQTLAWNMREALNAAIISNTTNILQGFADVVPFPRLTDTNDWYLLDLGGIVKPFIFQTRKGLETKVIDVPKQRREEFTAEYRGNAGFGLWWYATKTVNA